MSSHQNSKKHCNDKKPESEDIQEIILPSQSKQIDRPQVLNPFTEIKRANDEKTLKENTSQLIPNTSDKNNSIGLKNSVLKIKLYKSTIKPSRTKNPDEIELSPNLYLLKQKPEIKQEQTNFSNINQNQVIDKKAQYKLLIRKIAQQLKKKIRPRTKGYFYLKVIRNEKYLNIVKKIALSIKNKLGIHPPTNGAFYSFMKREEEIKMKKQKEEQYKKLIKKISSQLKKRIKLPTCKIIKIYESYRLLIKRIAEALKNSIKKNELNNNKTSEIVIDNEIKEESNDKEEKLMDIDPSVSAEKVNENINSNKEKEGNIENNKMDIETNDIKEKSLEIAKNEAIQTEVKKDPIENNEMKTLTYNQKSCWISSQKKSEENPVSIYTFSKMEVIDNDIQNSSEHKKPSLNSKKSTENKIINPETNAIPEIPINTDEMKSKNNKEEIISEDKEKFSEEKDKENIEEEKERLKEINSKVQENVIKTGKSMPNSTKGKKLFFDLSIMKKENLFNLEQERKKANKSHAKINVSFNLENLNNMYNKFSNIEQKENKDNNLSLQDLEITKSNFINQFEKFLEQENIEIINNLPVSNNEKNIILFQQSNFWYLILTYLFYKNNNLSLYNILYLLDQYNSWSKDKTPETFASLKERIKDYINSHNSQEALEQFLFMNKLQNLDDIFTKFESPIIYENRKRNDYIETKVEEICFCCENYEKNCKCDLCINDEACIQKVCEINKTKMEIVNNSSMDIMKKEVTKEEIIKRNNDQVVFHNNEALFYKGKSKKKESNIFSKSKTVLEDRGYFEFIHKPIPNPQIHEEEKKEESAGNIDIEEKNVEKEKMEVIIDNKDEKNDINETEVKGVSSLEMSSKKNFKNISKSERKTKEEEEEEVKIVSEGKEPKESKEEVESSDDESKIQKKEKKSRKGKSRKKNNNNKKKKETKKTKNDKDNEEEENAKEEKNEEEKENKDKSVQKKRKSTNRKSLNKNKSKICDKNENDEEEIIVSEEIFLGTRSVHKLEMEDSGINNSKRKKSKTPNKKKSRKH